MDENENPLAGYDLSAWDAPPPSAGLADAIVSRARAHHSLPVTSEPTSWKKPIAIVGALVAAAAVALFFAFGLERAPVDGRGDVKASIAQRLNLQTTSAMIEAGGELGWRRRGSTIAVTQRRGAATWTVGANDTLVLESGDPGAMGASIEAAGASLRVEVRMMNRSDARVIGVGSAVAAIVSVVTVVVYEGHVKATHDGQTVNISSGATAQFPAKVETPDSQLSVGGGAASTCDEVSCVLTNSEGVCCQNLDYIRKLKKDIEDLTATIEKIEKEKTALTEKTQPKKTPPLNADRECDEVSCVLNNYEGTCCAKLKPASVNEKPCDATASKKAGEDYMAGGMDMAALAKFETSLRCKDDVGVVKLAYMAACRAKSLAKAKLYFAKIPESQQTQLLQICVRAGVDPTK